MPTAVSRILYPASGVTTIHLCDQPDPSTRKRVRYEQHLKSYLVLLRKGFA